MDARATRREGSEAPFASPDRALLSLHGISKLFPGVVALSDVSLEFRQGEVHALVGENASRQVDVDQDPVWRGRSHEWVD